MRQPGGPIMLLPPAASPGTDSEPSQPVPTSTNPASANTAQSATLNAGAAVARPPAVREGTETGPRTVGGIVIGNLAAPDAEAAGLLDASSGGFGFDLWAGTSRGDVEALLARLPGHYALPAARDLALRLLLSTAAVPEGDGSRNLLAERMRLLDAMGETANALALAEALPGGGERQQWRRLRVDALLLSGEVKEACAEVGDIARNGGERYFDHALGLPAAPCRDSLSRRGWASIFWPRSATRIRFCRELCAAGMPLAATASMSRPCPSMAPCSLTMSL